MLHGQTRYNLRSRFLEELPEGALKWITPRQGGFSSPGGRGDDTARSDWAARMVASRQGAGAAPVANPPERKAADTHVLKVGMQVFHAKFGQGRVKMIEGAGLDARAQIDFPRHGIKWLALSVAKLTPIP